MSVGLRDYFPELETSVRRGRSIELLSRRDNKLAARFYYYSAIKKATFQTTIDNLVFEFDIRERVVIDRLKDNQEKIDDHFRKKTTLAELARMFPHFKW